MATLANRPLPLNPNRIADLIIVVALLIPPILHGFVGTYTRLMADDYCTSALGQREGLISGLMVTYQTWAGQFSNILFKNVAGLAGIGFVRLLPPILLIVWLLSTLWTFRQLLTAVSAPRCPSLWMIVTFAVVFFGSVIAIQPYSVQSLYWLAALVPYVSPLILFTLLVGIIMRYAATLDDGRLAPIGILFTAIVAFVAGGFSETYVILQGAALGMAWMVILVGAPKTTWKRRTAVLLTVALIASVAAVAVILGAPGNAVRQSQFPPPLPLAEIVTGTIQYVFSFFAASLFLFAPLSVLTLIVASAAIAYRYRIILDTGSMRVPVLCLIAAFGIVVPYIALGMIFVRQLPPARTYIIPIFFLSILIMRVGIWMGGRLAAAKATPQFSRVRERVVITVAVLLTLASTWTALTPILRTITPFQRFAAEWDVTNAQITALAANGVRDVMLPPLQDDIAPFIGLDTLTSVSTYWVNDCAARYYGISTLTIQASP